MMTHSRFAEVLTDLDRVIADAPADATGALWRLTGSRRGLDSNLIRLPPGGVIAEHAEPALDVLLVVIEGAGRLNAEDGPHRLGPHSVAWLPRGSRRSLTAGPDGMTYLTVHTRRPGLGIASAPAEGGEAACMLPRVCPDCGRLAAEQGAGYCSRCGSPLPG
ncbi:MULTISPECIES: cupin domain-containing protein [unclassified Streptomyces]|uniref:cupin domain-containing protein n=1 Tax=unclassified Streptomyces TaxID=2593676 RepID=UPI002035CA5D|nr:MULTISPECIES: AraC family ligand binding domain-containing protein [unclassified Streptomyces]